MRGLKQTPHYRRDIRKLSKEIQFDSFNVVQKLCINPFHDSLDVRKLKGYLHFYRVKVKRDYRIVFTFDETNIYLLRIAHRKDIYQLDLDFDF